jgi:hypothetical protein
MNHEVLMVMTNYDYCPLGCDGFHSSGYLPAYQRNLTPQSSNYPEDEGKENLPFI